MVGVVCIGVPSSIASFSIISNPSHNCFDVGPSLDADLFFFSADVVLLPPLLLTPCGGESVCLIIKFGSAVKFLVAPQLPPWPFIMNLLLMPKVGVNVLYRGFKV